MAMVAADPADGTRVWLAREGGLVAAPGLMRPREIVLADCSESQRDAIRQIVAACRLHGVQAAGSGDRRFFRIVLSHDAGDEELIVDEASAPAALICLWQDGPP